MKKKNTITKLLLWHVNDSCNLSCDYCSTAQERKINPAKTTKIDIPRLKTFLDNTKDTYFIVFTGGGEPFLAVNFIKACELITKKHFIGINTNLTSNKIVEFVKKIKPERVKYIVSSLHIEELEKRNKLDVFVKNYLLCKNVGFNIQARKVAHPNSIDKTEYYKKIFLDKGIELFFDPYIGRYENKAYPKAYSEEELNFLNIPKKEITKFYAKQDYCNAGYNAAVVDAKGDVSLCSDLMGVKLGNIYSCISYKKTGIRCPMDFCSCPLYDIDTNLLKQSLKHKPHFSLKVHFAAWQEKIDRKFGFIGVRIKKLSPKSYLLLKKIEINMSGDKIVNKK